MRKIVLTTIGTLGDLHPFIALAVELGKRGFRPVLAVAEDQLAKSRAAGIEAVAVLPGFEAIGARMGLSHDDAVRRIMGDQRHMLEQVLLPSLSSCAEALDAAAAGAEAIVASIFVFAAPIVAEKRGVPLVSAVLQPMAMLSAYDPPRTPDFWMMKHPPVGAAGARWNRAVYAAGRLILHHRYARQIDAVRAQHGLAPEGGKLMFDAAREAVLTLCCYSPLFGPLPPDAPANTRIVGFPIFDSQCGGEAALDPALAAFLAAGPAPLVFTLGTLAVSDAGNFYVEAAETARRLGERAVLLTGRNSVKAAATDLFCCAYAPHSLVFPEARVIVHHGGVGTTGQALRAGKPQLVVPHMGDQNDNAHRIEHMGVGRALKAGRFTADRAAPLIADLLREDSYRKEAARIGALACLENGAAAAAAAIEASLGRR
jgi:rhamnosyltransferase subunit B